jgi:hypothetical protein
MFPGMTAVRGVFGVFQVFVRSHIEFLSSAGGSSGICVRSTGSRQEKTLSERVIERFRQGGREWRIEDRGPDGGRDGARPSKNLRKS